VSGFERAVVGLSTWAMAITGTAFFAMKYLMPAARDPFSVIHHPWQPHALMLHVIVAPVAVFALGLIARGHILDRIQDARQRRGRTTGLLIVGLAAPMIAAGYLLQVVTEPGARRVLVGVHVVSGALYALLFAGHLAFSRPLRLPLNGSARKGFRPRRPGPRRLDRPRRRGIKSWVRRRGVETRPGTEDANP
jgi:hypothetical protein